VLLLVVGLLNLGVLRMAGRVWRGWRSSQVQDMLPHLVIQAGALLSGPLLALFAQRFRRPQTLRH
jgi:hypothetical protein